MPDHSSREVEGPALRNLGNHWDFTDGANSGRNRIYAAFWQMRNKLVKAFLSP